MISSIFRKTCGFSFKSPGYSQSFFASNNPLLRLKTPRFFSFTAHRTATHRSLKRTSKPFYSQTHSSTINLLFKPTLYTIFVSGTAWTIAAQFPGSPTAITQTPLGDFSQSQTTIAAIIAVNIFVFLLWKLPSIQATVFQTFLFNPNQILLDRGGSAKSLFAMLGSAFSHQTPLHLLCNLYVLWQFGPLLHDVVGRPSFLGFYVTAAMCSSWLSLAMSLVKRPFPMPWSLGASGAVFGVLGAFVCWHQICEFPLFFYRLLL